MARKHLQIVVAKKVKALNYTEVEMKISRANKISEVVNSHAHNGI